MPEALEELGRLPPEIVGRVEKLFEHGRPAPP